MENKVELTYDEIFDDYSEKFNLLSDKMKKSGIEISMLYNVLKARDKLKIFSLIQKDQNS